VNKNTLLLSITAIICLALIYTLFQDDDISPSELQTTLEKTVSSETKSTKMESNIQYLKSKTSSIQKNEPLQKKIKEQPPKREKYLESRTFDRSKKFEIALMNPNQDLTKDDGRFRNIQGKLDGESFTLAIPLHLIQDGSGDIKLRIRNLETNESSYTTAAFIDDMMLPSMHPQLSIDS